MHNLFKDIHSIEDVIKKIKEYQNIILFSLGVTAVIIGGTFGYMHYKKRREERAHKAFVLALEYFDATIKTGDEESDDKFDFLDKKEFATAEEKWNKVATVFKDAYENNSSSGIAPIFLAYQAQAFVELGKANEAIGLLKKAIKQMPNKEVAEFYKVKLALLLLAGKQEDEGLSILKDLASQDNAIAHDTALYRLGEYFWYGKNFKEAKNYWNQLVLKYGKTEQYPSPWVLVAKEKLRLVDSDVD